MTKNCWGLESVVRTLVPICTSCPCPFWLISCEIHTEHSELKQGIFQKNLSRRLLAVYVFQSIYLKWLLNSPSENCPCRYLIRNSMCRGIRR